MNIGFQSILSIQLPMHQLSQFYFFAKHRRQRLKRKIKRVRLDYFYRVYNFLFFSATDAHKQGPRFLSESFGVNLRLIQEVVFLKMVIST